MNALTQEQVDTIRDWCNEGQHYSGMSYEDGIKAVLDVLEGGSTVEELCE